MSQHQDGAAIWNPFNTLRPRQNGHHFPDDILKWIFLNENVWILINISLKFVLRGPINNIPALVQIMAWHWPGDKPLSEPIMVRLPTHICVTRPQWVKEDRGLFILHSLFNKLLMTWQLREPGHQLSWYWPSLQEYSGFSTISQIPQCIQQISHNAPFCTHLHISVTEWCIVGYGTGALWDFICNMSIV